MTDMTGTGAVGPVLSHQLTPAGPEGRAAGIGAARRMVAAAMAGSR